MKTIKTNLGNLRSLAGGAFMLMSAFTISADNVMINDTTYDATSVIGKFAKVTAASSTSAYTTLVNGKLRVGNGDNVYRAFNPDSITLPDGTTSSSIKLSDLNIGESLTMSFTAGFISTVNFGDDSQISFGFIHYEADVISNNNSTAYVADYPKSTKNSLFGYRAPESTGGGLMMYNWNTTSLGTNWNDNNNAVSFNDKMEHNVSFSIAAQGNNLYTLSLYMSDDNDINQLISKQTDLSWNGVGTNDAFAITGVAFRASNGFDISNLNVTYLTIPEPSAAVLLGLGAGLLVATATWRRRRG
ncbi:MAG: PEP-CTERM sorting domain-containing protein [Verrucomicrobiales bacterium]|jgi:hypothetical protein|nr:PEP-CTERM sorting domain-containing protein [Verrucomicrobiales bacterium]